MNNTGTKKGSIIKNKRHFEEKKTEIMQHV